MERHIWKAPSLEAPDARLRPLIQLLIAAGGALPGEIGLHAGALEAAPAFRVNIIDIQRSLERFPKRARAVVDEGEAGDGVVDRISQAAGGTDDRHAAI